MPNETTPYPRLWPEIGARPSMGKIILTLSGQTFYHLTVDDAAALQNALTQARVDLAMERQDAEDILFDQRDAAEKRLMNGA